MLTDGTSPVADAKELIRRGYERVKQFSWENTAKRYLAVFNRLKNSL